MPWNFLPVCLHDISDTQCVCIASYSCSRPKCQFFCIVTSVRKEMYINKRLGLGIQPMNGRRFIFNCRRHTQHLLHQTMIFQRSVAGTVWPTAQTQQTRLEDSHTVKSYGSNML